jgi:hypothetical protein
VIGLYQRPQHQRPPHQEGAAQKQAGPLLHHQRSQQQPAPTGCSQTISSPHACAPTAALLRSPNHPSAQYTVPGAAS